MGCLRDQSERVQQVTVQVFLPSFSLWAWELGRFPEQFLVIFVEQLERLLQVGAHCLY